MDNPALADYTAAVELEAADDGGTIVRWHGTYLARRRPRFVTQWHVRRFMQRMADGLASTDRATSGRG